MTISAEALRELHRLHRQATDLRDRLARGPKQIKARVSHAKQLEEQMQQAHQTLQRMRMTVDQKELSLRERENRILDIRAKLNSCSSNREYQAFVEQIAADEQANSVLSDEILELLDKVAQCKRQFQAAEQAVAEAREGQALLEEKVNNERQGLEEELARIEGELKRAESQLPQEVRADYYRVVRAHGEDALAALDGECCGGCYQRVTTQTINNLKLSRIVFCKACGRMLYLPES